MKNKYCFAFIASFIICNLFAGNNKTPDPQIKAMVSRWMAHEGPIGFEENKGQMADTDGKPLPYVFFKISAPGITMYITERGITYMFSKAKEELKNKNEKESREEENLKIRYCRIDMDFKGASILKRNIIKENPLVSNFNFFYNHCPQGVYGVKQFEKITIKDIYPGIDWKVYNSNDKGFKYDFIIHPGADPAQIELIYSSLKPAKVNAYGNIIIETDIGTLTENAPVSFQNNNKIATRFSKTHDLRNAKGGYDTYIKFDLSAYDNSKSLTIDPQLWWGTFYGGGSGVYGGPMDITTDANNNFYVTGYAEGTGTGAVFPNQAWAGAYYDNTKGGYDDAFILKFSGTGVLIWSTMYGGGAGGFAENDFGTCLTVDNSGNLFVAGSTTSAAFPLLNLAGAYNDNLYGGAGGWGWGDVFILKFNNLGVRQWATLYGGSGDDVARDIITDNLGNIWITGETSSANFPTLALGGAFNQAASGGGDDAFILKFSAAGALQWSTYYGGFNNDRGSCFSISNAGGFLLINGDTDSPNFPTQSSGLAYFDNSLGGISDAFILKISFAGVRQWATLIGGSNEERGYGIVQDNNGNIYTAGKTVSANFPTLAWGTAFFDNSLNGPNDIYISRFTSIGTLQWSTYFGGSGTDYEVADGYAVYPFNNIQTDNCDNIYIGFTTNSTNNTIVNNSCDYVQNTFGGGVSDIFLAKFNNTGGLIWSTYFGGVEEEFFGRITVDNLNNLFVSGEYRRNAAGGTLPFVNPGAGAYFDNTSNQSDDVYILKFTPVIPSFSQSQINSTTCTPCNGSGTVNVACGNSNYSYIWSNGTGSLNVSASTNTATGLCPGTYTVSVYSNCNNNQTATFTITGSSCSGPTVTATGNSVCPGNCGAVTASGAGGSSPYTYSWSNTATTQNITPCPVATTTYTVTIRDAAGGTSTSTAVVTVNPAVSVTVSSTNITCNGNADGLVTAVGSGDSSPYTYNWSPPGGSAAVVSGLTAGTYTVTITDNKGCTSISTTTIISPPALTGQFAKGTANCVGCGCKEWLMVTARGGISPYSYSWPDGYTNRYKNQLCPGGYSVNIKDKNGCSINVSLTAP